MRVALITLILFMSGQLLIAQGNLLLTSRRVVAGITPVIYLDFDGYVMEEGSRWAVFANGGLSYSTEPSGLKEDEIRLIYHTVAQDFRPWDVAVTTDSSYYITAPDERRLRVVFTSSYEWYRFVAGTSFLNAVYFADDTPVWVFNSLIGDAKTCGDVASHEAGHALGLRHHSTYDENCEVFDEYDPGFSGGSISWAPIMGSMYYTNLANWDNGDSVKPLSCTNRLRYDVEEISAAFNGIDDDVTDTIKNIEVLTTTHLYRFRQAGNISSRTDQDKFSFAISDSVRLKIAIQSPYVPAGWGYINNADLKVILTDSAGKTDVYAPFRNVGVDIEKDFGPGTYYLTVTGDGNEWMSNYGSLGDYEITGEGARKDVDLWVDLGPDTVLCEWYLATVNYYLIGDRQQNPPNTIYYWSTGGDYDPIIRVDRPGVYWVRAVNPDTKTVIATDTVVIMASPSVKPEFKVVEYDRKGCESWITFKDLSHADCIGIAKIHVDFGDGDTAQLVPLGEVRHRYKQPGDYIVKMTVFDVHDSVYEYVQNLNVNQPANPPRNVLGNDFTVCEGALYTLQVDAPCARWTWADGYPDQYREVPPGTYIVLGEVFDPFTGKSRYCSFSDTITITSSPHIIADFAIRHDGMGRIGFQNTTTTCDFSFPWYEWSFGPYGKSTEKNPSIKISSPSETIPVTLTVFNWSDTVTISRLITPGWLGSRNMDLQIKSVYSGRIPDGKGKNIYFRNNRKPVIVNSSMLIVDQENTRTGYEIIGANGQLFARGILSGGSNEVSISQLPAGYYILKIPGVAGEAFRFVKQ